MDSATTFLHAVGQGGGNDVSAPPTLVRMHSLGLYSAAGTCFRAAAWLNEIDVAHGLLQAFAVAHVADEEAHFVLPEFLLHFVLLEFVRE